MSSKLTKQYSPQSRAESKDSLSTTMIKHNIPHIDITHTLNTTANIQAFEIYLSQPTITLLNCFFPPTDDDFQGKLQKLSNIIANINTSLLIVGDFNAHHPLWEEAHRTDRRGRSLYNMTQGHGLVYLNTGDVTLPARYHAHEDTTPDITFATPDISRSSQWHTSTDTYFSDHRIIKTTLNFKVTNNSTQPQWNLKEARLVRFH